MVWGTGAFLLIQYMGVMVLRPLYRFMSVSSSAMRRLCIYRGHYKMAVTPLINFVLDKRTHVTVICDRVLLTCCALKLNYP